jgi:hypothetical protein
MARVMKAAPRNASARPRIERVSDILREVAAEIHNLKPGSIKLIVQNELNAIADSVVVAARLPARKPSPPPIRGARLP